ncbi:MAG: HAD-IIB family hydrolase [Candidatus Loosdrechtia sp.]|uniref:HAD-IIB family hydrolase n=1 Tax=Candidatus Loosdrechtia sp. TaxID=3101272 RepID=UPI003A60F71D|nr:MAG: HAD-IIB family hydrolase [Candidatus Jettenia sp. AMX2]
MKYIIFTDLDGTLLDHHTYSFEKAKDALLQTKKQNIPVIFCTSKTQAEIEVYRERMGNEDPFIPENGGAIIIPKGYFKSVSGKAGNRYIKIELGIPHSLIIDTLAKIKQSTRAIIKGFSDLTPEEISSLTGLDPVTAELSKKRYYSEPIIIEGTPATLQEVKEKILSAGLNFLEGRRFHHVCGSGTDKGNAVRALTDIYKDTICDSIKTIGIGDSLIDLPMLASVDIPIVVQRTPGHYDSRISLPNLIYADDIGPAGWNKAILTIVQKQ